MCNVSIGLATLWTPAFILFFPVLQHLECRTKVPALNMEIKSLKIEFIILFSVLICR